MQVLKGEGEARVRALITGITGFAGGHLAQHLLDRGDEVIGVAIDEGQGLEHLSRPVQVEIADLKNLSVVDDLLDGVRPDAIYHLAGQAFVSKAWKSPWSTFETNVLPQLNILQGMVRLESKARLLIVASGEIYGPIRPENLPVREDAPLRPDNPYGVSKVTQDVLGYQYFQSHKIDVLRVRAFNHIGPRQSQTFVSASFARQIAEAEEGLREPVIFVGNLDAKRDFTDVADVVHAYALLVEKGEPGEAYNVGTGRSRSVRSLLDVLIGLGRVEITVRQDPSRMRPSDVPDVYADTRKLRDCTGWEPQIGFEESLGRVLDYWREVVKEQCQRRSAP